MKAQTLSLAGIAGLLSMNVLMGCNSEDPAGPEQQSSYETAVYGTFRGFTAVYSLGGTSGTALSFDTTSYIHIEKPDSSYSISLHGTDKSTRTLNFSFEETGHIHIRDVAYTPAEGWTVGHWHGQITFSPDPALNHSPWLADFSVSEISPNLLSISDRGASIYLYKEKAYLWLMGWRTNPYAN